MTSAPQFTSAPLAWTPLEKLLIAVLAIAIVCFGFALHAEHRARAAAEATVKSDQVKFAAAGKQIAGLQAEDQARDKAAATQIDEIRKTAAAAHTSAQIVRYIHDQVKDAPAPIDVSIAPATAADPNPPAVADIPAIDLPFLRDKIATCSADAVSVPQLSADLASCKAQAKLSGAQLSAVENERDAWKRAAKGGTWAQRVKSGAIKFGLGVAAGVAIDEAARAHK